VFRPQGGTARPPWPLVPDELGRAENIDICCHEPDSNDLPIWQNSPGRVQILPAEAELGTALGDAAGTLAQMQRLLQQVKRKGSELEEEVICGNFYSLSMAGPPRKRQVLELQDGPDPGSITAMSCKNSLGNGCLWYQNGDVCGSSASGAACTENLGAASTGHMSMPGIAPSFCAPSSEGDCSSDGVVSAELVRLGELLDKVRRKTMELEATSVPGAFCSHSLRGGG